MGNKFEGSGNARMSVDNLAAIGEAIEYIDAAIAGYRQLAIRPTGYTVRAPQSEGGELLAVVKGFDAEGTPCVAFHSAFGLGDLMRGVAGRLRNGTLKWKIDQYAK